MMPFIKKRDESTQEQKRIPNSKVFSVAAANEHHLSLYCFAASLLNFNSTDMVVRINWRECRIGFQFNCNLLVLIMINICSNWIFDAATDYEPPESHVPSSFSPHVWSTFNLLHCNVLLLLGRTSQHTAIRCRLPSSFFIHSSS